MKALFFLLDGETNASSQHRVLQYLPLLREHGVEAEVSRPVPERMYQRIVEHGQKTAGSKAAFYSAFLLNRTLDVLRADRFDVAVIQRDLFPFGPPWLERTLLRRNPRLVYDTDDATYLRPVFTPDTPFQRLRRFDKVAQVVRSARWVSAATEPIAAWARQHNPNVTVVPMALDSATYDRAREHAKHGSPIVIGWAGTPGGLRYLRTLAPVLAELAENHNVVVRVISGGYQQVCLPGVQAIPWRRETGLRDMAQFDIGLVPLDDTPFERAKFPFKLLQYMALGVPAVSARVGVASTLIRHGENGFLATNPEEWRELLRKLIGDEGLRRGIAANARESVNDKYTVDRVGPLLVQGLTHAAS